MNRRPALRVDDPGIHAACCGANTWTATRGSVTVLINGKGAHRIGDQNRHCGGMGELIEGSPNVIVGESSVAAQRSPSSAHSLAVHGPDRGGGAPGAVGEGDARSGAGAGAGAGAGTGAGAGAGAGTGGNRATGRDRAPLAPSSSAASVDEHQLEVEVVSVDGTPQRNLAFDLILPSGATRTGSTPSDGVIRFSGLTEIGTCKLLFPALPAASGGPPPRPGRLRYVDDGVAVAIGSQNTVEVPPHAYRGRLIGMHFETAKSFLLPTAMDGMRELFAYYDEHPGAEVLVVGHTDTVADDAYNVTLSIERAQAIAAYLIADDAAWIPWFAPGRPYEKRWGTREVQYMLTALPDPAAPFLVGPVTGQRDASTTQAVRAFQIWSNTTRGTALVVDGEPGPLTRGELVRAYMAIEQPSLPRSTSIQTHGCGPFHQEVVTGPRVDEPRNRRAEVFLFVGGVVPAPRPCGAPGCDEYRRWVAAVVETIDLEAGELTEAGLEIELALFARAGDDVALVIEDSGGAVATVLAAADAVRADDGYLVFALHPAQLPNPVVFRQRSATGTCFVGGPCDPFALRDALRHGRVTDADDLLGVEPPSAVDVSPPSSDHFDDSNL